MRATAALVLVGLSTATAYSADDKVKQELKKFEGTWLHVSTERNGEKKPEPKAYWVIEENRAKVHYVSRPADKDVKTWDFTPAPFNLTCTYHLKLDPTASPKTLDEQTQWRG